MWNLFEQHTQTYITFVFVIIKTLHSIRMGSTNSPFFDDDKPNGHIDMKGKNKLVPNVKPKKRKSFEEIKSSQVKPK